MSCKTTICATRADCIRERLHRAHRSTKCTPTWRFPEGRLLPLRLRLRQSSGPAVRRWRSNCVRAVPPPPAPPRSFLAERGEFDRGATRIELRPPESPTPRPLPPRSSGRGENSIELRKPFPRVTL